MPKVITLEKAADGTYVVPDKPKVEEYQEEPILEKTVRGYRKTNINKTKQVKNKHIHEFIVKNGEKTTDFLDGVQKTVKILLLAKKFIK